MGPEQNRYRSLQSQIHVDRKPNMNIVTHRIRELMRRIRLLPAEQRASAKDEAMQSLRSRSKETDPQKLLEHRKELTMKLSFLKAITPKTLLCDQAPTIGTTYVLRNGELVPGSGEMRGGRVADGILSSEEAFSRNARDFKRLYGAEKPKGGGPFF